MAVTGRKDCFYIVTYNHQAVKFLLKYTACHNFCPVFEAEELV